jgi:hypothetical protein
LVEPLHLFCHAHVQLPEFVVNVGPLFFEPSDAAFECFEGFGPVFGRLFTE